MKGIKVSSNRYLGQFKQPDFETDPLELSESDVVWSSLSDSNPNSPPSSPATPRHAGYYLSDHNRRLVHRKPVADSTLLATSVARAIPGHGPNSLVGSGHRKIQMSAPINVPVWPEWMKRNNDRHWNDDQEEEDDSDENMVPPHELVAKSHNGTTFSVFEGVGRTLKGRDLRRVRNAIFQKTGVLE